MVIKLEKSNNLLKSIKFIDIVFNGYLTFCKKV